MAEAPQSSKLLDLVGRRMRLRAFAQTAYRAFLAMAAVYLTTLFVSRFTGVGSQYFNWISLSAVPALALVSALIIHRRPRMQDAARAVDQSVGARDLYLTLSLLDGAAGEYQPLVVQDAESRAAKISPSTVVPLTWQQRHWHAVWLPAATVLALLFLPQFDPFGHVEASTLTSRRKQQLDDSRKETKLRVAEVKKETEEHEDANAADKAVEQLQLTFNKMQPQEKRLNFESLMDEQRNLGDLWRKLSDDQLQNLMKTAQQANQQFGSGEQEQMRKWTEQLQAGSTDGLRQEMEKLKQELQKLAKTDDPVKKEEIKRELKERLNQLEKFAQKNLENKALAASLQRAMSQLDLASLDELSSEALEGAMESLELSEMELEQLAQAAKDLKRLDEALKALQMAKRLNDREKLDGKECQQCKSLSDYEKLYKELLAKCEGGQCQGAGKCAGCGQCQGSGNKAGNGNRSGMGGRGTGQGGIAPTDDSISTEFQTELAKSAVTAGKVLMSMKSKGQGERGDAVVDYQGLVRQVQQGASEAILQEQIPPGYHEGIKSYFDALKPEKSE